MQAARLIHLLLSDKKDKEGIEKYIDKLTVDAAHNAILIKEIIDSVLDAEPNDKKLKNIIRELFGNITPHGDGKVVLYTYAEHAPQYIEASDKANVLQQLAIKEMTKKLHQVNSNGDINKLDELYRKYRVDMLGQRKKLILQLRGFLMVFEQVMSDYLSQLSHIGEIFSFDDKVQQIFYPTAVADIHDMEALFIDFEQYKESHLKMVETPQDFISKRNNILDHLLSRFSESMSKYGFFMQQFEGEDAGKRLVADKINFLKDYVQVSSYRGKGYNYADPGNCWNCNNVEGIKKRICRLLGIKKL